MRGPEGPAIFGRRQAESLLNQFQGALAVKTRALGVDARRIVEQSRRRRPASHCFRGVLYGLAVALSRRMLIWPLWASPLLGSSSIASSKSRSPAWAASTTRCVQPRYALHGRGRVQLERAGEILDRAGWPSSSPGQSAPLDRPILAVCLSQVAIECFDNFDETAQPEQGFRPQAAGPANGLFAATEPRQMTQVPGRTSRQVARDGHVRHGRRPDTASSCSRGNGSPWSKSPRARSDSLRSRRSQP